MTLLNGSKSANVKLNFDSFVHPVEEFTFTNTAQGLLVYTALNVNRQDYSRFGMPVGVKNWATRSRGPGPNKTGPQIPSLPAQKHFTYTAFTTSCLTCAES